MKPLSNVAFFIPVVTPRYFTRPECLRELQFFTNKTASLGITELVMPILYIDVADLHDESNLDPYLEMIRKAHWEDWQNLRFKDRESGEYRAAVSSLAQELVRRVELVERADVVAAATSTEESPGETEAGTLDKIAALEEAMPRWSTTMESLKVEIEAIGGIMSAGSVEIDKGNKQGKGFAARLTVARRLASDLAGPVAEIEKLGQRFALDLGEIDTGVRVLLESGVKQAKESTDPSDRHDVCEFVASIRNLSVAAKEGLGSLEEMIEASKPLEGMSKDMRPPLRRLRASLTAMLQARETTDAWLAIIDTLELDCSDLGD